MKIKLLLPIIIVIIGTLIINLQISSIFKSNQNLDKYDSIKGDFVYYLEGAHSILEYDAIKKFNDKKQPIMKSEVVKAEDLPKYASEISILYPHSSFKYGYSLTSAILTGLFPNSLFEKIIPRLTFTNIVLSAAFVSILFLLVYRETEKIECAVFCALFVSLDPFFINNNLIYQSHTLSGLFYLIFSLLLFTNKTVTNLSKFFIGLFLSLSILSSSHFLPFAIFLLIGIFFQYYINSESIPQFIKSIIYICLGFSIFPLYILFVEYYISFKRLGIPTFIGQYSGYGSAVKGLIQTYGMTERTIWDLSIWNTYFNYIIFIFIILIIINFKIIRSTFSNIKFIDLSKLNIIILASVIFILINLFISQPIARAIVPNLILINILFGSLCGWFFTTCGYIGKIGSILVLLAYLVNYQMYSYLVMSKGDIQFLTKSDIIKNVPILNIREIDKIWDQVHKYFQNGGNYLIPSGSYGRYSMSIKDLVIDIHNQYNGNIPENLVIKFEPLDIVQGYSNTRRFIPEFTKLKENLVNPKVICIDFKIFCEIFEYSNQNELQVYSEDILYYNPTVFDQEYNYIYGYRERIHEYLTNTSLNSIDFRKVYFIKYSDLLKLSK